MGSISSIAMTEERVEAALARVEPGLRKYCWIQERFGGSDVSRDALFQTRFNDFYRVRRDDAWRRDFYGLMERAKMRPMDFGSVLRELLVRTGRLEASFASKLVATLNPDRPVVDRYVLLNFGLHLPYYYAKDREAKTLDVYETLCRRYEGLLASATGVIMCRKFSDRFPWARICDLKKVDLIVWQSRD